jgi:hypothetical protein
MGELLGGPLVVGGNLAFHQPDTYPPAHPVQSEQAEAGSVRHGDPPHPAAGSQQDTGPLQRSRDGNGISTRTSPGTRDQVAAERADLRALLTGCPHADIILCVSELAANGTIHSDSARPGGTITVYADIREGDYVRIEVHDGGGSWTPPAPDPDPRLRTPTANPLAPIRLDGAVS